MFISRKRSKCFPTVPTTGKIDVSSNIGHMPSGNVQHKAHFCWGYYVWHWGWLSWLNIYMWALGPEFEPLEPMEKRNLDIAMIICNPSAGEMEVGESSLAELANSLDSVKDCASKTMVRTVQKTPDIYLSVCTGTYWCAGVHTGVHTHTFTFPTKLCFRMSKLLVLPSCTHHNKSFCSSWFMSSMVWSPLFTLARVAMSWDILPYLTLILPNTVISYQYQGLLKVSRIWVWITLPFILYTTWCFGYNGCSSYKVKAQRPVITFPELPD